MGSGVREVVQVQKNSFSAKVSKLIHRVGCSDVALISQFAKVEGGGKSENSNHVTYNEVHISMCLELTKLVDSIVTILPAIESARPGCSSGIQELCCLHNSIEKARLLLQDCAESSKLYLAITGETTLLRCERIRSAVNRSLCQIQNMVPPFLASQISEVLDYLRNANFIIDSVEKEASRILLELLSQNNASEDLELEAFQIASTRLNITSPKAIVTERRAIKKLRNKIHDTESKKRRLLRYLLHLLDKHEKNMRSDISEHENNVYAQSKCLTTGTDSSCDAANSGNDDKPSDHGDAQTDLSRTTAPAEFCCPISSRLMFDPVVIASGQTYDRKWIEKWFDEGHDICPKTKNKLANLAIIPNSCMKDLISNWCSKHGISIVDPSSQPTPAAFQSSEFLHCNSISSLKNVSAPLLDKTGVYMVQNDHSNLSFISSDAGNCQGSSHIRGTKKPKDKCAPLFPWSDDFQKCQSFSNFNHDMFLRFFYGVSELSLDLQGKAVEDVKILLEGDEQTCCTMLSNGFAEALLGFLKNAYELPDVQAQKTGAQLFLAFLSNSRVEIPSLGEDVFWLLTSFLDSDSEITTEALMILQKLSHFPSCRSDIVTSGIASSVIKFLDSEDSEFLELVVRILGDLSLQNEIKSLILSSGCISQLVSLLSDRRLVEFCIKIMQNLSDEEEAAALIAETNEYLAAIVGLLNTGTREEQEYVVAILHSICTHSSINCLLVLKEGVIPTLVEISVNGNANGKENSVKLLHLLRDIRHYEYLDSSCSQSGMTSEPAADIIECSPSKAKISKSSGFFGKIIKLFSKARSLAARF